MGAAAMRAYCGIDVDADRDVAQRAVGGAALDHRRGRRRRSPSRSSALIRRRRRWRLRTRNIGAGPSSSVSGRQRLAQLAGDARRGGCRAAPPARRRSRSGPGARRAGSAAARRRSISPARKPAESWRAAWAMLGALGRQGLDDHLAPGLAAAAAPGQLGDHREGPLLGAEVGEAQGRVGVEDRAQGHLGEVVALGDHLGADEDAAGRLAEARRGCGRGRRARRRCRSRGGRPASAPGARPAAPRSARCRRRPARAWSSRTRGRRAAAARRGRSGGRRGGRCGGGRSARRRSWGSPSGARRSGR